jgi:hypothetical protein
MINEKEAFKVKASNTTEQVKEDIKEYLENQEEREEGKELDELFDKAKEQFLENTDTQNIIDMLDEKEEKRYWELNNKKLNNHQKKLELLEQMFCKDEGVLSKYTEATTHTIKEWIKEKDIDNLLRLENDFNIY